MSRQIFLIVSSLVLWSDSSNLLLHDIEGAVGHAATAHDQHKRGVASAHAAQNTAARCAHSPEPDGAASPECQVGGSDHEHGRDQVQQATHYLGSASSNLKKAMEPLGQVHDTTKEAQRDVERHPDQYQDPGRALRELAKLERRVEALRHRVEANHVIAHSNTGIMGLVQTLANQAMMQIAFSKVWKWLKSDRSSAERVGSEAAKEGDALRSSEGVEEMEQKLSDSDKAELTDYRNQAAEANKVQSEGHNQWSAEDARIGEQETGDEDAIPDEEGDYAGEVGDDAAALDPAEAIGIEASEGGAEGLLGFLPVLLVLAEMPPGSPGSLPAIDGCECPYAISLVERRMGLAIEPESKEHSTFWFAGLAGISLGSVVVLGFIARSRSQRHKDAQPGQEPLLT